MYYYFEGICIKEQSPTLVPPSLCLFGIRVKKLYNLNKKPIYQQSRDIGKNSNCFMYRAYAIFIAIKSVYLVQLGQ